MADLHAIVLAAGAGRRFGGRKLLAMIDGVPVLHRPLAVADAAPVRAILLVVGCDADRTWRAATAYTTSKPVKRIDAADWRNGMGASLRAGISRLPADAAGAFVFLGDMPWIDQSVLHALGAAVSAGAPAAAPVSDGRIGHPVVFGQPLLRRASTIDGDRGARGLLAELGPALRLVPAHGGCLADIDCPEDLAVRYE